MTRKRFLDELLEHQQQTDQSGLWVIVNTDTNQIVDVCHGTRQEVVQQLQHAENELGLDLDVWAARADPRNHNRINVTSPEGLKFEFFLDDENPSVVPQGEYFH